MRMADLMPDRPQNCADAHANTGIDRNRVDCFPVLNAMHPVNRFAPYHSGQQGHASHFEGVFPDAVNLVDDLHVARQQLAHDLDRPLFQSLRHHCVVGEGQGLHTIGK